MELVGLNLSNMPGRFDRGFAGVLKRMARFLPAHSLKASRSNVAHHYDLSERLYRLFLDEDMQYSCAYFERPDMTLEEAQFAKKDHIAAKLFLKPGMSVLDIGCGWGGMAVHLARRANVRVTGITLSIEQIAVAVQRAQGADMYNRVHFDLCDYRQVTGSFDRIVSVGMFEHVGLAGYDGYFRVVADRLNDDGVALIHTIGRRGESGGRSQWLDKYIFPGGYLPSLSEITRAAEKSGLWVTDIEMLRLHYAETMKAWRQRFETHRDEIRALYDERFCRMWEFYLCYCELGFRYSNLMVFQLQLAKKIDTLPITRDYMMHPPAASTVVDFEKAAGKLREGARRLVQPLRQGEARREQGDGAAR
ncbi:MAG: class I SAM-dependent methyltransferase [Asticcacaulis sp.]|nr:class I SAM-dependent methyltransferase [Asticcacaulis sp.]